jgi:hypothetical protein
MAICSLSQGKDLWNGMVRESQAIPDWLASCVSVRMKFLRYWKIATALPGFPLPRVSRAASTAR